MWGQYAQDLLDAAAEPLPGIRKFVASGPDFRRDCRQVVVALVRTEQVNQPNGQAIRGSCATMTQGVYGVWFTDDCVPSTPEAPPADDTTAHAVPFLDEVEEVQRALEVQCQVLGRRCSDSSLSSGEPAGPTGTYVTYRWEVTLVGI